jgi:hypothetical protein
MLGGRDVVVVVARESREGSANDGWLSTILDTSHLKYCFMSLLDILGQICTLV